MRASTLFVSALLGAGALARPSLTHLHLKRNDNDGVTTLKKQWTENGVLYKEFQTVHRVVTPGGSQPDASQLQQVSQPEPQHQYDGSSQPEVHVQQKHKKPKQAAPKVEQVKQEAKADASTQQDTTQQQVPKQEKVAVSTPSSNQPSSGSCSSSSPDTIGGDASSWTASNLPCADGKSVLDYFNELRKLWRPELTPYTWDDNLAEQARQNAMDPSVQNGGNVMKHPVDLGTGVGGQCIAESLNRDGSGKHTDFKTAATMWMCELPAGGLCPNGATGNGQTGHADIIKSSRSKCGCYFLWGSEHPDKKGLWTCNFSMD